MRGRNGRNKRETRRIQVKKKGVGDGSKGKSGCIGNIQAHLRVIFAKNKYLKDVG